MTQPASGLSAPPSALRVLIVDDSAFMRASLRHIVSTAPGWVVAGEAADGEQALDAIQRLRPDAVTLDVDMPVLDGIGVLRRLRPQAGGAALTVPAVIPAVIMVSAFTTEGAALTLTALSLGALDFVPKASEYFATDLAQVGEMLRDKLATVADLLRGRRPVATGPGQDATAPLPPPPEAPPPPLPVTPLIAGGATPRHAAVQRPPREPAAAATHQPPDHAQHGHVGHQAHHGHNRHHGHQEHQGQHGRPVVPDVVVMASSTGGPLTLPLVLAAAGVLPVPVVIAQHIPPLFSRSLAQSLSASLDLPVMEAEDGQELLPGRVYLLPGGRNGEIIRPAPGKLAVRLLAGGNVTFRPNADILFRSAALNAKRPVGVILTGMGSDGREGARALVQRGRPVLVQNPATAVIWGMPQAAVSAGLATAVLDAPGIGAALAEMSAWRAPA